MNIFYTYNLLTISVVGFMKMIAKFANGLVIYMMTMYHVRRIVSLKIHVCRRILFVAT